MPISIDWDSVEPTQDAWRDLLARLLEAAREAASGTSHDRQEVIEALSTFIARSPSSASGGLDVLARATADELFAAAAEDLIRSIDDRRAALDELRVAVSDLADAD